MANILDYLHWRGDLRFSERPMNEIDSLILAELCYIDFSDIVPASFDESISVKDAAARYFSLHETTDMGVLVPNTIVTLLAELAKTARFSDISLCAYESSFDAQAQCQFAALCALCDGACYVAFRGTDDSIVGWKEDLNMAFMDAVPAQTLAKEYLARAAAAFPAHILRVGGHSKGGNLALYAAVCCEEGVQNQISAVYNNDGPGLHRKLLESAAHKRIEQKIHTIVPESSVIGMLLAHEERYTVVRSTQSGLFQHDGFSWQLTRDRFDAISELNERALFTRRTMHAFLDSLTDAQRAQFVDALYEILTCTNAITLTELKNGGIKTASAMLRAVRTFDKPTRHAVFQVLKVLLQSGVRAAGDELSAADRRKNRPNGAAGESAPTAAQNQTKER